MINKLKDKLHTEIPLTKLMQLDIDKYTEEQLITRAPLDININDKGTAFGGSLSTMTIISSWSICWLISQELNIECKNIVVIKNTNTYKKPVRKELICYTQKPKQEEINKIKEKLETKGSSSIKIRSQIIEDEEVCVEYEGTYVLQV